MEIANFFQHKIPNLLGFYQRKTRNSWNFWQNIEIGECFTHTFEQIVRVSTQLDLIWAERIKFVLVLDNFTRTLFSEKFHFGKRSKKSI